MGYKSIVRSLASSGNKILKEQEKQQKAKSRQQEKVQKNVQKIIEKQNKIYESLDDIYAKGKLSKKEYESLKLRKPAITLELIVLGKSAGVSLGKRYITGQIDDLEFQKIQKEILPHGFFNDQKILQSQVAEVQEKFKNFQKECNAKQQDACMYCAKKKGFLTPLKGVGQFLLCNKCSKALENILHFKGFSGEYLEADSIKFTPQDMQGKLVVPASLSAHLFL